MEMIMTMPMMDFLTDKQIEQLNKPLEGGLVRQRKVGGTVVSYLEGYTAIDHANKIFGYGGWSDEIIDNTPIVVEEVTKGDKKGWYVGYRCEYRLTVYNQHDQRRTYTDVGYGDATDYNSLLKAHESAGKEAVTDAMKRTMRKFGNQFGLALYDKEQKNVDYRELDERKAKAKAFFASKGVELSDIEVKLLDQTTTNEQFESITGIMRDHYQV